MSTAEQLEAGASEIDELARKLTLVAFLRVAAVSAALLVLFLFAQVQVPRRIDAIETWHYALITLTYVLSIGYAVALRFKKRIVPLAYLQIGLDCLVVTVVVLMTGGVESIFALVYVFTVFGAASTLYRLGAILAAVTANFMFGVLVLLQLYGSVSILPKVQIGIALFSYFLNAAGVVMVAVLSSTLAEKVRTTGRRLREKESDYQELEELHASILRSLPAGLLTLDPQGVARYANESALSILRVSPENVLGRPIGQVVPGMAERWGQPQVESVGPRERYEAEHLRPDGKSIRVGFSFAPLGGKGSHSVVVFQDVTEIVRLKEAYERAQRLASVGRLAAGLAHEVRNPLASMCASIEVLETALAPAEPMGRLMKNVVREADRLNALISDFLEFARPREPKRLRTDLSLIVQGVLEVSKNDPLLAPHSVHTELAPGLFAMVDADQVRQVLWNIVRNAAEAMGSRPGRVDIRTRERGDWAEVVVTDTGPGLSEEQRQRIFVPFYTTKERGSGLGLAISHSIVEAHGGRIFVESKPGVGTEVTVAFLRQLDEGPGPTANEWARTTSIDLEILGGA